MSEVDNAVPENTDDEQKEAKQREAEQKEVEQNTEAPENKTHNLYDTLTPKVITGDSVQPYFDALDFALSKPDVTNIAVTGPYGAGKSSVILSYFDNKKNQKIKNALEALKNRKAGVLKALKPPKMINVSLADFALSEKKSKENLSGSPDNTLTSTEIEFSILQQILYKENENKLPDSRVERIKNRNYKHVLSAFILTIIVIVPILTFLISIFPRVILSTLGIEESLLYEISRNFEGRLVFSAISGLIGLYAIVYVASKIGFFDKKLKISKIAFLQGSADLTSQESPSLLNQCLDEIVYFFSRSKYNVVVFEDLDRLENAAIFIKLREINKVINNNRENNPVRFIYACREDIFLGGDVRSKFFDFILPIIPVMDTRNASTHLENKLKDFPIEHKPLLKRLSRYISDMRAMQNIVNEFNLFKQLVDNANNQATILALIFYKNTYAQDYNLIDKQAGVLYSFIRDYRSYRLHEKYFSALEQQLSDLNEKISKIQNETTNSDLELRKEIIVRYISFDLWPIISFAKENRNNYPSLFSAYTLCEESSEFVNFFKDIESFILSYNENDPRVNRHVVVNNSAIYHEYEKRINILANKKEEEHKSILIELNKVKEKIRIRNTISLAEIIKLMSWDEFKETALVYINSCNSSIINGDKLSALSEGFEADGLDALYYLLINGYIKQDFMMFRSIFQPGSISQNDNEFIKAIERDISCVESNQQIILENPKNVLDELISEQYQHKNGAIHHQIIRLLLSHQNKRILSEMVSMIFQKPLHDIFNIFNVLNNKFENPNHFRQFLIFSLEKERYLDNMISVLIKEKEEENENNLTLISIAVNMIVSINPTISSNQNAYRQFVEELGFTLISSIESCDLQGYLYNCQILGVIYHDIHLPITPEDEVALRFIAENQMYSLSESNYAMVVSGLLKDDPNISYETVKNYPWSSLKDERVACVKKYVNKNIDDFVRDIFIASKESIDEIIEVFKHSDLNDELRFDILRKMQFTVSTLDDFDIGGSKGSYLNLLYAYDHILPTWKTLIFYIMDDDCDNEILVNYIEKHAQALGESEFSLSDNGLYTQVYLNVICNEQIGDAAYSALLKPAEIDTTYWDDKLTLKNFQRLITDNKVKLDEVNYINAANLFVPNDKSSKAYAYWLSQFKEIFLSNTDFYLLKDDGCLEDILSSISQSNNFTVHEKVELLLKYRGEYSESFLETQNFTHEILIKLLTALVKNEDYDKAAVANLLEKRDEKEFIKIFKQKTATLNVSNKKGAEQFLKALKAKGMLKKWSKISKNKYFVDCLYD
ncbi:DNA-binding protein [Providencia rettgeri]|uniref:YobI family P-loop NTPase n=1 Tax=Providencia rettgeri TaxID=587 RepID=UPI0015EBB425|nr:DNA-binding protein [Providencia rettgeri]